MLSSLKFCQGSVAKKNFIPSLTHFVIENGHVRGFNGVLALSSPIPFNIACKPEAATLIKAISNCDETVQLALTPAGRLSVKSGSFKAFINCVQENTPHALPEGEIVKFDGEALLAGLKAVAPFIGDDASRRWANGVLFEKQCLMATNNVTLVQYWVGFDLPHVVNIPRDAVKEMIRISEAPIFAQLTEHSITFHYNGDRWLRTQLYEHSSWPDIGKILDHPSEQNLINQDIFVGLEVVKPFVDQMGSVFFTEGRMASHKEESEGASFDLEMPYTGCFNVKMLEILKDTVKTIDWSKYPGPCLFQNDRLRGAIIGMRK